MIYLLITSLLWAFSFGLVKNSLSGIDSNFVAAARLGVSLLVFLPFVRPRGIQRRDMLRLILCGAVQYGGMYIAYLYAFRFLQAYEVALFTIFTPLYVTLLNDLQQRRFNAFSLAAVFLTIAGTWIVQGGGFLSADALAGFWIVQISNLCFAFGQLTYRRLVAGSIQQDVRIFALPYLGGFLAAALSAGIFTNWSQLVVQPSQWLVLLYLGVIASGLGFFLWNVGARQVQAGTLAIFNDLKIPLAVIVSLLFFGEKVNLLQLTAGGSLALLGLYINEWSAHRALTKSAAVQ